MAGRTSLVCLALCLAPVALCAQTAPDLAKILERLDRLEQENRALSEQVRALQAQLGTPAPPPPTVEERLDIQQQRIEEHAQTKVEASQKFPIRLAGMALFNAFVNSKQSGGADYPVTAAPTGATHAAVSRQLSTSFQIRMALPSLGDERLTCQARFSTAGLTTYFVSHSPRWM